MVAASRAVSTSGSAARALMEPARSRGAVGRAGGWTWGRSPGSGVGGHCCSWACGATAGGGRSALPSAAGVGPYLDPASRCGVSSLVGGLIVRLPASQTKWDRSGRYAVRLHVEEVLTPTTRVAAPDPGHRRPPAPAALPSVDDSMHGNGALSSGVAR